MSHFEDVISCSCGINVVTIRPTASTSHPLELKEGTSEHNVVCLRRHKMEMFIVYAFLYLVSFDDSTITVLKLYEYIYRERVRERVKICDFGTLPFLEVKSHLHCSG